MSDDLVKRLRIGIHKSVNEQALRDEAADRIEELTETIKLDRELMASRMRLLQESAVEIRNLEAGKAAWLRINEGVVVAAQIRIELLQSALKKAADRFDEIGQNDDAAEVYAALEGKKDEL